MKLTTVAFLLLLIGFWTSVVGLSLYGLYLGFSASIVLGIAMLFVEPSPLIVGLAMFFFQRNLAQELVKWLSQ